ncbi:hypothetical protein [Methylobacterium sp. CM6257]
MLLFLASRVSSETVAERKIAFDPLERSDDRILGSSVNPVRVTLLIAQIHLLQLRSEIETALRLSQQPQE